MQFFNKTYVGHTEEVHLRYLYLFAFLSYVNYVWTSVIHNVDAIV